MNYDIDINSDVGEGAGNESELMPFLASCNIACGGHAGDDYSMLSALKLAKLNKLKIGAHPSFPDRLNFGRKIMVLSDKDLYLSLRSQIERLLVIAEGIGAKMHHIKPHGALYNLAAKDKNIAGIIIKVLRSINQPLKLYVPFNSVIADLGVKEDIDVVYEAFADRNYNEDLSLVSRQKSNALITNKEEVYAHVMCMLRHNKVKSVSGVEVPIKASTFCIHSDTKNALEIAKFLAIKLNENNCNIL